MRPSLRILSALAALSTAFSAPSPENNPLSQLVFEGNHTAEQFGFNVFFASKDRDEVRAAQQSCCQTLEAILPLQLASLGRRIDSLSASLDRLPALCSSARSTLASSIQMWDAASRQLPDAQPMLDQAGALLTWAKTERPGSELATKLQQAMQLIERHRSDYQNSYGACLQVSAQTRNKPSWPLDGDQLARQTQRIRAARQAFEACRQTYSQALLDLRKLELRGLAADTQREMNYGLQRAAIIEWRNARTRLLQRHLAGEIQHVEPEGMHVDYAQPHHPSIDPLEAVLPRLVEPAEIPKEPNHHPTQAAWLGSVAVFERSDKGLRDAEAKLSLYAKHLADMCAIASESRRAIIDIDALSERYLEDLTAFEVSLGKDIAGIRLSLAKNLKGLEEAQAGYEESIKSWGRQIESLRAKSRKLIEVLK